MEVRKITLAPATIEWNRLGKKKKTNLRRKLIIEYIQSKPAGELIRVKEFQEVGQFSTTANTHTFIQRMIRDGVISQYNGDRPRDRYYAVTGAVRVHKPEPLYAPSPEDTPITIRPATQPTLEVYARQFAWDKNSDSLRHFISWMEGKDVEYRRVVE